MHLSMIRFKSRVSSVELLTTFMDFKVIALDQLQLYRLPMSIVRHPDSLILRVIVVSLEWML